VGRATSSEGGIISVQRSGSDVHEVMAAAAVVAAAAASGSPAPPGVAALGASPTSPLQSLRGASPAALPPVVLVASVADREQAAYGIAPPPLPRPAAGPVPDAPLAPPAADEDGDTLMDAGASASGGATDGALAAHSARADEEAEAGGPASGSAMAAVDRKAASSGGSHTADAGDITMDE
jgi:hypothetical protein